jgi:hypothetical protein|tara:strand:+ start:9455 stop:9709 length:255 start_codon:yes stop_codon:yes gene_type:complete
MFSLSSITATFASTQKRFKKFGKKLRKQRDGEVDGIKDKIKEIAGDEVERTKGLFEKHKDFFKKNKTPTTPGSETTAIDFYEKP